MGAAAARADSPEQGVSRPLDFQPRYSPKPTANWVGAMSYLIFLLLFLSVTIFRRDSDVYYFSETVKHAADNCIVSLRALGLCTAGAVGKTAIGKATALRTYEGVRYHICSNTEL